MTPGTRPHALEQVLHRPSTSARSWTGTPRGFRSRGSSACSKCCRATSNVKRSPGSLRSSVIMTTFMWSRSVQCRWARGRRVHCRHPAFALLLGVREHSGGGPGRARESQGGVDRGGARRGQADPEAALSPGDLSKHPDVTTFASLTGARVALTCSKARDAALPLVRLQRQATPQWACPCSGRSHLMISRKARRTNRFSDRQREATRMNLPGSRPFLSSQVRV